VTPAVIFDNVSKKFRRGERHDSLRDLIPSILRRATRARQPTGLNDHEFWALRNVSFEVKPGEALGVIGSNGAGKSTALKLLTRILKPTEGACRVVGRTGALIEVAAGFHPDLTGRENVYMQGAIMGMKRAEIAQRLDDIVEFAGVQAFIDTQTKRYSSGMNARLGFAVAAHLNPDVLIIDEVLAVGDTEFQQRCMMRMLEFKRQGVAIVFVSHNMNAVADLCSSAMLLDSGRVKATGPPRDVINAYLSQSRSGLAPTTGSRKLALTHAEVSTTDGAAGVPIPSGAPCRLQARLAASAPAEDVVFTFYIRHGQSSTIVYGTDSTFLAVPPVSFAKGDEMDVILEFQCNLLRGSYFVEIYAYHPGSREIFEWRSPAAFFEVVGSHGDSGVAALFATCRTEPIRSMANQLDPLLTG
jgi:lipopolysaccharide transport system ATP-binding protein